MLVWKRLRKSLLLGLVVVVGLAAMVVPVLAQNDSAAGDDLSVDQARLADRYERLKTVATRLAELSASTDPRRARLLRDAIARSNEQDIGTHFESIVKLLEQERLAAATRNQETLQVELRHLLEILLKADQDQEIESRRRRLQKYLREIGRLIRLQKGLRARTEGGEELDRLSQDQQEVAGKTGKLGQTMEANEGSKPSENSSPSDSKRSDPKGNNSKGDSKGSDSSSEGESGSESEGGSPQPSTEPSADGSAQQPQPIERATKQLQTAQKRMQSAQQNLEKDQRKEATAEQRHALKELQQAKAELERVLRQLREEEMDRTLTLLAARFRKMLDMQLKVYEGTIRLDRVPTEERDHEDEIEAARLSRQESLLIREADKVMLLLREEGSSVAFPEAVEQMREDMQEVMQRVADLKVGQITQGLEEDIIEALEETLAALDKAMKDLEKNRTPPGQSPPPGQPTEPPLVDKLAELRMIRSLQLRINRRTRRYSQMLEDQQAEPSELLEALSRLAKRQERVYRATRDLHQGRND